MNIYTTATLHLIDEKWFDNFILIHAPSKYIQEKNILCSIESLSLLLNMYSWHFSLFKLSQINYLTVCYTWNMLRKIHEVKINFIHKYTTNIEMILNLNIVWNSIRKCMQNNIYRALWNQICNWQNYTDGLCGLLGLQV